MIPKDQDPVEYLILNKGLEVSGVDEKTGELLYSFTEKVKELMPDLYHAHMSHVNKEIMTLWELGFLEIDLFSDNPIVKLTGKAFINNELDKLPEDHKWALDEIKRMNKRRNF